MDIHRKRREHRTKQFYIYRQKGGTEMNWFYKITAVLREHGCTWQIKFDILGVVLCIAIAILVKDITCVFIAVIFFLFVMWEIDDALNKEKRGELTKHLAFKCDEVTALKEEVSKLEDKVSAYKTTQENKQDNPIKSNRIISDKTFAVRLLHFAEGVSPCDAASEEELNYFKMTAERLLRWQTKTVRKNSEEYKYLERLGLMPQPSANSENRTEDISKENKLVRNTSPKRKIKKENIENENQN